MQHKMFCVLEFIKTQSATAVHRAFRLRFNSQPPTRKSICRWNHQFEQIGCLCKGKSSGRPNVSEENVRRIQESSERSPRKSTRRASRELGIPQPSGVCWGAVYCSIESIFWIVLYLKLLQHTVTICCHNTDLVHVNGHDRTILVIFSQALYKAHWWWILCDPKHVGALLNIL